MSKKRKNRRSRTRTEIHESRMRLLRRILGILLLLLCLVPMLGGGVQPLWAIPAAIIISMYDSAYFCMLVGVISGISIDLALATPLCTNAIYMVCFCTVVWLLFSQLLRPNFIYFLLTTAACALLRSGISYLVTMVLFQVEGRELLWERVLLPSSLWTVAAAVPVYLLYLPCIKLLTKHVKPLDAAAVRRD